MYVCICKAVTERQLRDSIDNGATSLRQLKSELNIAVNCGACSEAVEQCIENVLANEAGIVSCSPG